ncbi:MAG: hypothetical protein B7X10_02910 [Burkholderiales bacterium 21-58-4]|nr:MAG: hypothetical protein B7X10_02910 [Burkholderiales bacterium 21-58-4]
MASHHVVASFDVGDHPDVLAADRKPGWIYLASESGIVSVFKIQGNIVTRIGGGLLGPNAHVVAVDPVSHRSYFPLKDLQGKRVLRIMRPRP